MESISVPCLPSKITTFGKLCQPLFSQESTLPPALREEPEHLIALEIGETGGIRLLFNGPGHYVWRRIKHHKNPQKYASSKTLIEAPKEVDAKDQIPIVKNIFEP
jgi:hypothetical protein